MSVMVLVREITADDWELMRDVRLSALALLPSNPPLTEIRMSRAL
jgi:hypothetical protein